MHTETMKIALELTTEKDLRPILELQKRAFSDQARIYNDYALPSSTQTIEDIAAEFERMTFYKADVEGNISRQFSLQDSGLYASCQKAHCRALHAESGPAAEPPLLRVLAESQGGV